MRNLESSCSSFFFFSFPNKQKRRLKVLPNINIPKANSEPRQTSKMELLVNIVYGLESLLTVFAKSSILDLWVGPECASVRLKENFQIKIYLHGYRVPVRNCDLFIWPYSSLAFLFYVRLTHEGRGGRWRLKANPG